MRVGFFVTCLVDLMRPSIGFAAIRLLEAGGAEVFVPPAQTCCGQPAYNSGDRADAKALAREGRRRVRGLRLPGRAVGILQRHDPHALRRPLRRRPGDGGARRGARREDARAHRFPRQRAEARRACPAASTARSPTTTAAPACARWASRRSRARCSPRSPGLDARRDGRVRDLLRLRRHVLDQVRRDLGAARRQQVRAHRGERRRTRSCWAISAAC